MTRTLYDVGAVVRVYESQQEHKRRPGRPSIYEDNPKWVEETVLFCAAQGMSLTETAVAIGVKYKALLDWEDKYDEFANTLKEGKDLCRAWWLNKGRVCLHREDFNATLWMMNMSNRFGWSRKVEGKQIIEGVVDHKHTHSHTVGFDFSELKRKEVENLRDYIQRATEKAAKTGRN